MQVNDRRFAGALVLFGLITCPVPRDALGQIVDCCRVNLGVCDEDVAAIDCQGASDAQVSDCLHCIPAGVDCWRTPCGRTKFDFCFQPIPPGFFAPGSEQFDGEVQLGDDPTTEVPGTFMLRTQTMVLDNINDFDDTEIQLTTLNLFSCGPITVIIDGSPTQWDVAVTLSATPAPPGLLTATKTHANGGTFTSEFSVQPVFTFTEVGDPQNIRILDTGAEGIPPMNLKGTGEVPWVHVITIALDPDSAYNVCGNNFFAGVEGNPGSTGCDPVPPQCCRPIGHSARPFGPGHLHVTGMEC